MNVADLFIANLFLRLNHLHTCSLVKKGESVTTQPVLYIICLNLLHVHDRKEHAEAKDVSMR